MSENCHETPDLSTSQPLPDLSGKKTLLVFELTGECKPSKGVRIFFPYRADKVPELILAINTIKDDSMKLIANGVSRLEAIGLCAEALTSELIANLIKNAKNTEEASLRIRKMIMGMEGMIKLPKIS